MTPDQPMGRRSFLRRGGIAVAAGTAGAGAVAALLRGGTGQAAGNVQIVPNRTVYLAATDTWLHLPVGAGDSRTFMADDLGPAPSQNTFAFGFRELQGQAGAVQYKGAAQECAPLMVFDENDDIIVNVTNLGFQQRPDLADGHTLHWHGFRNATPYFDGVPETATAIPPGRWLQYYFKPRNPGTYMYHCHFEDVEHVQMGMTGVIFVRPKQNTGSFGQPAGRYVFNDGDGSTRYDREYSLLFTDWWIESHWKSSHIQQPDWSDFTAEAWLLNGRSYPDTLEPSHVMDGTAGGDLVNQPYSSLIKANPGERVLIRLANLGYQRHSMTLPGIPLRVVGKDATLLRGRNGEDLTYETNTIDIAPGESWDVLFTAPNTPNATYPFYGRDYDNSARGIAAGGGQMTEVRISDGSLPAQTDDDVLLNQ